MDATVLSIAPPESWGAVTVVSTLVSTAVPESVTGGGDEPDPLPVDVDVVAGGAFVPDPGKGRQQVPLTHA
jgi:hypothetical protein